MLKPVQLAGGEQRVHRGHAAARLLHQRTDGRRAQGMHRTDREDLGAQVAGVGVRIPIVRDRSVQFDVITSSDSY